MTERYKMSDPIKRGDLTEIYDCLWRQLQEDRNLVLDAYNNLKSQTTTKEDYTIQGLVLSKLAELCIKQTSQLVDVIRINQKETNKSEVDLDADDKKELFSEIGN